MGNQNEITILNYLKNPAGMSTEKSLQLQNAMDIEEILNALIFKGYIYGPVDKPDGDTGDILKHVTLTDKGMNL